MKIDALDHPKTVEFSTYLGVCIPQAIGHLELLWAFVAQKTPRGNVGKWSNAVIAHAAQWTGNPDDFVNAIVKARYLDKDDEHRLCVHDWSEHCPNWVRAKLKKEGKAFISGNDSGDLSNDLRKDLTGHYKPSQAKGSQEKEHMSDSGEPDDGFEQLWREKPKRPNQSKPDARKAYNARIREGAPHADLLAGLRRYNEFCRLEETLPKHTKHLATFLGPGEHWKQPWKSNGKVPTDTAEIMRLVRSENIQLAPNCPTHEARKAIAKQLGMAL